LRIAAGEKFGLMAIQGNYNNQRIFELILNNGIAVSTNTIVNFDKHWSEWLGSIRSEQYQSSNVFFVAKELSKEIHVIDAENYNLARNITSFYYGLLLAGRFSHFAKPLLLTGANDGEQISIRQVQDMLTPMNFSGVNDDNILDVTLLEKASAFTERLKKLWDGTPRYKRLRRIFNIYVGARTTAEIADRLHQYCRCIEGFILPPIGGTKRNFRTRTETFIGPRHHDLMGAMYDFRSAIEHLNDHLNLISNTREERAQIYKWAHIAEYVARTCLTRVLLSDSLLSSFETDEALAKFWELDNSSRQKLWGDFIDPLDGAAGFDVRLLSNAELGLPEY
jgi:hypothetical protein